MQAASMPKAEAVKEETSRTGRCCKLSRYRIRSIRTAGSMHDKCWPNRLRRKSCQAPQFPYHPPNPTKQTTNPAKISWPTLHAINPRKRTIEVIPRRANTMQENIRKFVEAAGKAGCPTLAVPLPVFRVCQARVEDHKRRPVLVFALSEAPPTPLHPRQNVAKSVAKARKTHQGTTHQHQPDQQHTRNFRQKIPHPPLFRPIGSLARKKLRATQFLRTEILGSIQRHQRSPRQPLKDPQAASLAHLSQSFQKRIQHLQTSTKHNPTRRKITSWVSPAI